MRTEADLHVDTAYRILHEDPGFLVVEKPAPLPVHPVGRFTEKNLLSLLRRDRPSEAAGLRIVNRIDSETSGLVLVARSSEMAGRLGLLFEKREVTKDYTAVVIGKPARRKGLITLRLGTVHRGSAHMRCKDARGETAATEYEVLKGGEKFSLLRVMPRTGRKHQIRAHLAFIGHPVAGDKLYIDSRIFERYMQEGWQDDMRRVVYSERLLLHASGLGFRHPESGRMLSFDSGIPECFKNFLKNVPGRTR